MNVTEIINDNDNDNENKDIIIEISPLYLLISIIPCVLSILCIISYSMFKFIKVISNKF